ncbi:MAG: alpha/beta hydrolase [Parvularculaceae bacterium]
MTGGVRAASFAVDGGEVEADIAGEGAAGAPILFLHGWTLDRRMWAPQMSVLSARHPVIALDRRGFGRSTAPASLDQEPEDIVAILDALSVGACVIVGMSQAGRVALDFTRRYPARVAALVLQGAQIEGVVPVSEPVEEIPVPAYRELVRMGEIARMREQWRAHPLMYMPNAAARRAVSEILEDYDGRDLLAPPSKPLAAGAEALAQVVAPILVITGDEETAHRRRIADAIAETGRSATRVVIKNAGHLCNLCDASAYNTAVEDFLSKRHLSTAQR